MTTDAENLPDRKYQDLYNDYQILSEDYQNLYDDYQDLSEKYDICTAQAEFDEEELKEQIAGLENEISELKDDAECLEETCFMYGGRISDLEYLIDALQLQIRQYSERYSKMHRLVMPFAEYCFENSKKDRPEIGRLISDFKDSMTKILAETDILIQSLLKYNVPYKLSLDDKLDHFKDTPAAGEQPSAE